MVNNQFRFIQSDVKIYELYFPDEDWMYHDINKEYITNQTKTYILKDETLIGEIYLKKLFIIIPNE